MHSGAIRSNNYSHKIFFDIFWYFFDNFFFWKKNREITMITYRLSSFNNFFQDHEYISNLASKKQKVNEKSQNWQCAMMMPYLVKPAEAWGFIYEVLFVMGNFNLPACLAWIFFESKCPAVQNCSEAILTPSTLSWWELTSASTKACFFNKFCTEVKSFP